MHFTKDLKKLLLAIAVTTTATGVIAATQGTEGTNSSGNFDVTFDQGAKVRVWGLQDLSFTGDLVAADLTKNFTFCTFSNNTDEVVFKVESSNGNFTLVSGSQTATAPIDYKVQLANKNLAPGAGEEWSKNALVSGAQGFDRYSTQSLDNGGASNLCVAAQQTTDLTVTIPKVATVPGDGAYTDTVTLTIQPI